MSIIEAVVLGLVQGLTEFIPISSTAHLEIVPVLLGWGDPGAAASAVIQFGTSPIVVLGLVLKKHIESTFRGLWVITTMVIVVAILMELAERYAKLRRL